MSTNCIPVLEIFGPTIQGEGPNVGAKCIFVRVKGCSWHCSWCDSKYTWMSDPAQATMYSPAELVHELSIRCKASNCKRIVLTGGNPCLYDFTEVLSHLSDDIILDIETQGDILPSWLSYLDTIVFSPKAPSSGMPDVYDNITEYINQHATCYQQIAIKIPVFDNTDIEFASRYAEFVNKLDPELSSSVKLYLSVGNSDVNTRESIRDRVLADYEQLIRTINNDMTSFENVFILPQIHTLIWGNKSGV